MNTIDQILPKLRCGDLVVLADDEDRENEGDLVCAAEHITPEIIAFMATHGRGLICVPMSAARAMELALPPMTEKNTAPLQCNFTVSVDSKNGVSTGISAHDRAHTIELLLNKKTKPAELSRPGHVFPLIANEGGVLARRGHTEGALDLMQLAGLAPMAVICEIMDDDGTMMKGKKLMTFAKKHGLGITSIQAIIDYRKTHPRKVMSTVSPKKNSVTRAVEAFLPTEYGQFRIMVYTTEADAKEHVAIVKGTPTPARATLVRLHSECFTGDVLHSVRCDCQVQLEYSLKQIGGNKNGVVLYMRDEGRGIGLINKLKAYNLQDKGYDTVEANEKLGFKADMRDYALAAEILKDIGVGEMHLMTNNPEKITGLEKLGLKVSKRLPIQCPARGVREQQYMETKKKKLGHLLS